MDALDADDATQTGSGFRLVKQLREDLNELSAGISLALKANQTKGGAPRKEFDNLLFRNLCEVLCKHQINNIKPKLLSSLAKELLAAIDVEPSADMDRKARVFLAKDSK